MQTAVYFILAVFFNSERSNTFILIQKFQRYKSIYQYRIAQSQFGKSIKLQIRSRILKDLNKMEKLRSTYKKYQTEVFATNPRYVDSSKVQKYVHESEKQITRMQNTSQWDNYDEVIFYKEKFQNLSQIASQFQKKKISQQAYHRSVRQVMEKDFVTNLETKYSSPPVLGGGVNPNQQVRGSGLRNKSKSPLKDFFDDQEVKMSKKLTFSNILATNQTPLKYGLKSTYRGGKDTGHSPGKDLQLKRLQQQNRRLRNHLQNQKNLPQHNGSDDERLKQLRNQVRQLDQQNRKLRTQVSKGSRSDFYIEQEYDPYNLKVRQNNIVKINTKNLYQSQRASQFGGGISQDFVKSRKGSQIYYDSQLGLAKSQFTHNPKGNLSPGHRSNNILDDQILNASQSTIQTQFLNLQNSELYDEQKHQICRQKIAFFKKSMVLVKGSDFDIAFKRSEFNSQMDKLRLILYVNNKDVKKYNCTIEYDYDRADFQLIVKKQLTIVEARSQARQQIEVCLKNATDLGSLITAKILVGGKMKKIVVPTLFIDFDPDYKYQFQNIGYIQRNISAPLIIKPMSQFSSIDNASAVLQLNRQYEQKYQIGKLYGKSKACKGMVKLSWKTGNKLKIQTCQEWRTLMGYLFLNAQETIHY